MTKEQNEIEETQEFKNWVKRLNTLDEYINSLKVWDNHAEQMQSKYDELLAEDPRIINGG